MPRRASALSPAPWLALVPVALAVAACHASPGYNALPLSSTQQGVQPPRSIQEGGGSVQMSPPVGGVPGVPSTQPDPPPGCQRDSDCVPAVCCHARACAVRTRAPSCAEVACSGECEPRTVDCGGGCACVVGACVVRLATAADSPPVPAPAAR